MSIILDVQVFWFQSFLMMFIAAVEGYQRKFLILTDSVEIKSAFNT